MTFPPSLARVPNPPIASLTDDELLQEHAYWEAKINESTAWGAALSQCDKFRKACAAEMDRRGLRVHGELTGLTPKGE